MAERQGRGYWLRLMAQTDGKDRSRARQKPKGKKKAPRPGGQPRKKGS